LKDVDTGSNQGARAAIDNLHVKYASDIDQNVADLKERLKITDDDSRSEAFEKVKANAAKRKAKNKVKNRVDQSDLDVIEKLAGDTQEGSELLALMRKSNELSALANKPVKGGLSQFTDIFNPLDTDGRFDFTRAISAPVSGLGAISTSGASLIPAAVGRGVDAVTGRRSRVARYVNQNRGDNAVKGNPNLPSLRTQKQVEAQQAEQQKLVDDARKRERAAEAALINLQRGNPPKGDPNDPRPSPQYQVEAASGLTRKGVGKALKAVRRTRPDLINAANGYQQMLERGEGTTVPRLNDLIAEIKGLRQRRPELFSAGDTQQPQVGQGQPQQQQPAVTPPSPEQRQQGIDDNNKVLDEIVETATKDKQLSKLDKARVKQAVAEMRLNLGPNPAQRISDIIEDSVATADKPSIVRTYLQKYLTRVRKQQRSRIYAAQSKSKIVN
ncbi:MAG: hypothetical protein CMQ88_03485, partial [Gammaproteobacteria bacterium]|nr:hypothetical protein [Gammaproteobacteria bacterium]